MPERILAQCHMTGAGHGTAEITPGTLSKCVVQRQMRKRNKGCVHNEERRNGDLRAVRSSLM